VNAVCVWRQYILQKCHLELCCVPSAEGKSSVNMPGGAEMW